MYAPHSQEFIAILVHFSVYGRRIRLCTRLSVWSAVWCVLFALAALVPALPRFFGIYGMFFLFCLGVLTLCALYFAEKNDLYVCAQLADETFGLKEQTITALEAVNGFEASVFREALVRRAVGALRKADPSAVYRVRWDIAPFVAALCVTALLFSFGIRQSPPGSGLDAETVSPLLLLFPPFRSGGLAPDAGTQTGERFSQRSGKGSSGAASDDVLTEDGQVKEPASSRYQDPEAPASGFGLSGDSGKVDAASHDSISNAATRESFSLTKVEGQGEGGGFSSFPQGKTGTSENERGTAARQSPKAGEVRESGHEPAQGKAEQGGDIDRFQSTGKPGEGRQEHDKGSGTTGAADRADGEKRESASGEELAEGKTGVAAPGNEGERTGSRTEAQKSSSAFSEKRAEDAKAKIVELKGIRREGDTRSFRVRGMSERETLKLMKEDVKAEYARQDEAAISRNGIPLDEANTVKRYFLSIIGAE